MSIAWEPWGPEAFERAKREKKPVLLLLSSYPRIAELSRREDLGLADFVPVFADHRDRPDVARRFPSDRGLVVLSHDFERVADLEAHADGLADRLRRAAGAYAYSERPARKLEEPAAAWTGAVGFNELPALDPGSPRALVEGLLSSKEPVDSWGLELLLHAAGDWNDAKAGRLAAAQLQTWVGATFADDVFALAHFLRLFADGALVAESEALAARAKELGRQLLSGRQPGQPIGRRYLGDETRAYGDVNAFAALGLLRLARLGDQEALAAGLDLLAVIERDFYDPMLGIVHRRSMDGRSLVYGLLDDNAWAALAFTEAFLLTGDKRHRDLADGLVRFMFQELWDRDRGGFADRIAQKEDLEPLKSVVRPAAENAVALEALWRLHHLKGNANYKRWLEWGLRALWAQSAGAERALLGRLHDLQQRGRMDFELVGHPDDPNAKALLAALNARYLPRKIVSFVDPDDQDYILAHKLEAASYPRLFACDASLRPIASTDDPQKVAGVIETLR